MQGNSYKQVTAATTRQLAQFGRWLAHLQANGSADRAAFDAAPPWAGHGFAAEYRLQVAIVFDGMANYHASCEAPRGL